ncbi:MAG: hypothetical protein VKL39_10865 [Leptolyngbyaceae bacterium]|nr:hypothetical protein [Leptolyngbyaceae bacterium]
MNYTTERLTEILVTEFDRCTSIISDKPQYLRTSFDAEQDAIACQAYQDVKRQIWHYQIHNQVSGLVWCEYEYAGHAVTFPKVHSQLIAIDRDIETLKAYKTRVVQWWLDVVGDRPVWREYLDHQRIKSTIEDVLQVAQVVDWAIPVIEDDPKVQVLLCLEWGIPEDVNRTSRPASGSVIFGGEC